MTVKCSPKGATWNMVLLMGLLLPFGASARDITDSDMIDVWSAVRSMVASDDRILDVEAFWSEGVGDSAEKLVASVTTRPFSVGQGLCVVERYMIAREAGRSHFELENDRRPISGYWKSQGSCDYSDIDQIPPSVLISQSVPTTQVARIIDDAEEILRQTRPEVRCPERIMPTFFRPDVQLRLSALEVNRRNELGVGIRYRATYTREGHRDGIVVTFTIQESGYDVTHACNWMA